MMNKKLILTIIGIIAIAALVGIILGSMFINFEPKTPGSFDPDRERLDIEDMELYLKIKTGITFVNMAISAILISIYVKLYRETKADFTLGLIIVMASFFIYALMSCPLIPHVLGIRPFSAGVFTMVPDIFATVALATLLYISKK